MENFYFSGALFCTGIFFIQFILSMFSGDFDLDTDTDFDLSSVVSFKGLIHFGIGFFWNMWFWKGDNQFTAALVSVLVGIFFIFVLAGVYFLAIKLKNEIRPEKGEDLVGRSCMIYSKGPSQDEWIIFIEINGAKREISASSISSKDYTSGEKAAIQSFREGHYYIA